MITAGRVAGLIQAMGGGADPAVIESAVQDWLDAHPEATTTVQDGSITEQKLATSIAQKLGLISSLSDEIEELGCNKIAMTSGYIATNADPVNTTTVVPHAEFYHAVVPCQDGDIFTVSAQGGSTPISAVFIDANGTRLLKISEQITDVILIAPENSVALVINDRGGIHPSYYGLMTKTGMVLNKRNITGDTISITKPVVGQKWFYINLVENTVFTVVNNSGSSCGLKLIDSGGVEHSLSAIVNGATAQHVCEYDCIAIGVYINATTGPVNVTIHGAIERIADAETNIKTLQTNVDSLNYTKALYGGISYDQMLAFASASGLSVSNGVIARNGTKGTFTVRIESPVHTPIVVRAIPTYSGYAPYMVVSGDNTYKNKRMEFYNNGDGDISELRIPPLECGKNTYYDVQFAFPEGASINFIELVEEKTLQRRSSYDGVDVNSHLGFDALAPENTMPAFIAAYRSGYDAIICNPKLTSDGVWVCVHDTEINRLARNADGTEIENTITVAGSTYSELLAYDFGIAFNTAFAGTKIPTLDAFLKMCAVSGIRPIFSMHESSPSQSFLSSLYNLVSKYGLVKELVLKISASQYTAYHDVFGEIWMYDFVTSTAAGVTSTISAVKDFSTYGKERFMIDVSINVITQAIAESITSENIICGVYDLQNANFSRYKMYLDYGVTQFTDDNYPVTGLKWI